MKRIYALMLCILILVSSIAIPVVASDRGAASLDPMDTLESIGIGFDLNLPYELWLDANEENFAPMPKLYLLHDARITISSEADVRIILDALAVVFELTSSSVSVDWGIMTALEDAGLREYFQAGIRYLLREERAAWIASLFETYTIDELLELNNVDMLDLSFILEEAYELGLPLNGFDDQMGRLAIFEIAPRSGSRRVTLPSNFIVQGVWMQNPTPFNIIGTTFDYTLVFRRAQAGVAGFLDSGNVVVHFPDTSFVHRTRYTATDQNQHVNGSMIIRDIGDRAFALRATHGPIFVAAGAYTMWW